MGRDAVTATDTTGTGAPSVRSTLTSKATYTSSTHASGHTHTPAPGPKSVPASSIGSSRSFRGLGINFNTKAKVSSGPPVISPPRAIKPSGPTPSASRSMPKLSSSPNHGAPSTTGTPPRSGALRSRGTLRLLASPTSLLRRNTTNVTPSPPSQQKHQRDEILNPHRSDIGHSPRDKDTRSGTMGFREMRAAIPPLPSLPSFSLPTINGTGKLHGQNTVAGPSSSGSHVNSQSGGCKSGKDVMDPAGLMPAAMDCRSLSVDDIVVVGITNDGIDGPHIQVQEIGVPSSKRGGNPIFSRASSTKSNLNTKPKSTEQEPFAPDPFSRNPPQSPPARSGSFRALQLPVFLSPKRKPSSRAPPPVVVAPSPVVETVSSPPAPWALLEALSPTQEESSAASPSQVASAPSLGHFVSPQLPSLRVHPTLSLADEIETGLKSTGKRDEANITTNAALPATATMTMTTPFLQASSLNVTPAIVGNNENTRTPPSRSMSPQPQSPNSKSQTLIRMIATKFRPRSPSPSPSPQRKERPKAGVKPAVAATTPMGAVSSPPISSPTPSASPHPASVPGSPSTPQLHTVRSNPLLTLRSSSSRLLNSKPSKNLVPAPGTSPAAKEAREAALRERGLLPPLKGHKDLSRQEREQDAVIPVVSPPPEGTTGATAKNENGTAEGEGVSAADLIKKQWEERNRVAAGGASDPMQDVERKQRERLNSFKFGGAPPRLEIKVDAPEDVKVEVGDVKEETLAETQISVVPLVEEANAPLASPPVVSPHQATRATVLAVQGVNPLAIPLPSLPSICDLPAATSDTKLQSNSSDLGGQRPPESRHGEATATEQAPIGVLLVPPLIAPSAPVSVNAVELAITPPGSLPCVIVSAESGDASARTPGAVAAARVRDDDNKKPRSADASAAAAAGVPSTSSQAQLQAPTLPTGSDSGHSTQSRTSTSVTPSLDHSIQTLTNSTLHTSEAIGNGAPSTGSSTKLKPSEWAGTMKSGEVLEAIVEDTADVSSTASTPPKRAVVEQAANSQATPPPLPPKQQQQPLQPNRRVWEPVSVQGGIPSTPSTPMGLAPTKKLGKRMSFNIFGKWGNGRDNTSATPHGSPALSTPDSAKIMANSTFSSPRIQTPDENSALGTPPAPSLSPTPGGRKLNAARSFTSLTRSVVTTWSKPKKDAPLTVNTCITNSGAMQGVDAQAAASPQGQQAQFSDARGQKECPEGSFASVPLASDRASSVAPLSPTTSAFSAPAFPGALPAPNRKSLSPTLHRPSSITFLNRARGSQSPEPLSPPSLRPRQSVSPTLHSRGSILMQVGGIEDDETRRVTELAFLG